MAGNGTNQTEDRLILRSRLTDLARVPSWVESLGARYSISENVQFAINLCLEEALSNVIRHGYAGAEDCSLSVSFTPRGDGAFEFVVEDEAPGFNPLEAVERPVIGAEDTGLVGGQGIRLLQRFTDGVEYQRMPNGNRLRMWFSDAGITLKAK